MSKRWHRVIDLFFFALILIGLLLSGSRWALLWALVVAGAMTHTWKHDD